MITRIGFGACGVLVLTLVFTGDWAPWKGTSPREAWVLDDPIRLLADFAPHEKMAASFRLSNTAHVPLRILGASIC